MSEQYKMPEQQKLTNYHNTYQTWNAKLQTSKVPKCHNHHRNKAGCHLIHQLESIDKDIQGSQVTSNSDVLCNLLNAKIFNSFNYSLFSAQPFNYSLSFRILSLVKLCNHMKSCMKAVYTH